MLLPTIAALDALIYLYHLPLHLAFCLAWRDGLRTGSGLAPMSAGAAMAKAVRAMGGEKGPRGRGPLRRLARELLGRTRIDAANLTGRLSLGDAAATALACGALEALGSGLRAALPCLEVRLQPDFGGDSVYLEARGMLTVRAGHIMTAAARHALDTSIRRMKAWTSTPLRI